MNNKLLLIILLVAILGAGFYLYQSSLTPQEDQGPDQEQAAQEQVVEEGSMVEDSMDSDSMEMEEEATVQTYTLDEVREHDSADDCWLVIDDKVYDVTGFESKHGGGDALLEGCGIDSLSFTKPDLWDQALRIRKKPEAFYQTSILAI